MTNSFEVVNNNLIANLNGQMYVLNLYDQSVIGWFVFTWHRDTRKDKSPSPSPFLNERGERIILSAQDWPKLFWVVLDNLRCEVAEYLLGSVHQEPVPPTFH